MRSARDKGSDHDENRAHAPHYVKSGTDQKPATHPHGDPVIADNGGSVALRRLTRRDAATYHAFRQAQLALSPSAFTSTASEESLKPVSWAADRLEHPERPLDFVIGAFDITGGLVGIAGLAVPGQRQARHKGTLFGMAVAGEAMGRGIGRALVEQVLEEARRAGLLQVVLTVSEDNRRAVRLYRACGFVIFGCEPRAVILDARSINKLHMVCMLDEPGGASEPQ